APGRGIPWAEAPWSAHCAGCRPPHPRSPLAQDWPIADNALADRVLARTILVDERLIHHRDARASHAVLPAKRPATQNWDPHGGKVSAADRGYVGLHCL